MKNKIIMLICATLVCVSISAQKMTIDKVPAPVASAFKSKYPEVIKANWRMEDGKNYVAEFKMNEVVQHATFNSSGGWLKTETPIKVSELPTAVTGTISKEFSGYTIQEASKMENADHGHGYDVEIAKGKDMKDVTLSSKGVVMSQGPHQGNEVKAD